MEEFMDELDPEMKAALQGMYGDKND